MKEPNPVVLLVEDEPELRKFLRVGLEAHGYRLLEAGTAAEGLTLAAANVPEVVLLDLGLPDMDGIEVARRLRTWSAVPIIVLSARGQEEQKVQALDAGADDYLTKPFGFAELLARLRVSLRHAARLGEGGETVFHCGILQVDLAQRRVTVDGHEVHLTRIEYKLLETMIQNAGRVITHRQLLLAVWGPHGGQQTHYLRVYMTHLRRKLEPDPLRQRLFETEIGVGYRLRCDEDSG